jgi:hypothetical protein
MLDLEILKIGSRCDDKYLAFMIGNCINIKELTLGVNLVQPAFFVTDAQWSLFREKV